MLWRCQTNACLPNFEDLALPLFDQLYNFAHWLTQDRSEAEDLVQETYTKALRGFPGFQAARIFGPGCSGSCGIRFLTSRTGLEATVALGRRGGGYDRVASIRLRKTYSDREGERDDRAASAAGIAGALSRDSAALRGRGNVVRRDRSDAGDSGRHGDVAAVSRRGRRCAV